MARSLRVEVEAGLGVGRGAGGAAAVEVGWVEVLGAEGARVCSRMGVAEL